MFIKVLLPITVPEGLYCWNYGANPGDSGFDICPNFDNEGGHASCDLGFKVIGTPNGIKKSPKCAMLREYK